MKVRESCKAAFESLAAFDSEVGDSAQRSCNLIVKGNSGAVTESGEPISSSEIILGLVRKSRSKPTAELLELSQATGDDREAFQKSSKMIGFSWVGRSSTPAHLSIEEGNPPKNRRH